MLIENFTVESKNLVVSDEFLTSTYEYESTELNRSADGSWTVKPTSEVYEFRTERRVPKLG